MAFHPQTNRASERMIHKMSQVLRTLVRPDQLDWPKHLPMTEFAINSSMSASTGFTPFELMYGYLPWIMQSIGESPFTGVQNFADNACDMVIMPTMQLLHHRSIKLTKPTNSGEVMTLCWK
jgi:hypothetical protein